MNTIACQDCGASVVRGHAHIRSIRFVQVGWCRPCWALRADPRPIELPEAYAS